MLGRYISCASTLPCRLGWGDDASKCLLGPSASSLTCGHVPTDIREGMILGWCDDAYVKHMWSKCLAILKLRFEVVDEGFDLLGLVAKSVAATLVDDGIADCGHGHWGRAWGWAPWHRGIVRAGWSGRAAVARIIGCTNCLPQAGRWKTSKRGKSVCRTGLSEFQSLVYNIHYPLQLITKRTLKVHLFSFNSKIK